MPRLFNPWSRNLGRVYHGKGSSSGSINVSTLAAIGNAIALTPQAPLNVGVGAATGSSVALTPSTGSGGSSAVVQSTQLYPGTSKAFTSANTGGNLLVCLAVWNDSGGTSDPTITDTRSNAWSSTAVHRVTISAETSAKIFYMPNCAAGSNTVSLGSLGAGSDYGIVLVEVSGIKTAPTVAVNYVDLSNQTSPIAGSLTVSVKSGVLVLYADENAGQGTITAGSGYTMLQKDESHAHAVEFKAAVAAGAITPGFTISSIANGSIGVISFEEA